MSSINKWITAHGETYVVLKADLSLAQENDRLRRENRILKEERDILKNRSGLKPACAQQKQPVLQSRHERQRPFAYWWPV